MYAHLRRKRSKAGFQRVEEVVEHVKKSPSDLALDVACEKERDNLIAIQRGMPAVGSRLTNVHGLEWFVDGHTSAASLATYNRTDNDLDLYPVVLPQNLSKQLSAFAAEIDCCTPKALVSLDTMPYLFPKRAHPNGHCVDAWSDPYRILLFLDVANLHETVLAHELAHVWIDLVLGIEDNRVYKDWEDTARYSQVQFLQSFVLDLAVNDVLRQKGFDTSIMDEDSSIAERQLAKSIERGYRPPTQREAVYLASFIALGLLERDNNSGLVRQEDFLLPVRSSLPEVFELAKGFEAIVRENPPTDGLSARRAIDEVLLRAFAMTDGSIDLDAHLIEVEPQIRWDHDKSPNWLPGLPLKAKCEVGQAMAKLGATSADFIELSYNATHRVQVRFRRRDETYTDFLELATLDRIPESNEQSIKQIVEMNQRNRKRVDEMVKTGRRNNNQTTIRPPTPNLPPMPGRRSYSQGMARWLTLVRLEEQLAGEHPYNYAFNNPTTYMDPSGLRPDRSPCEQAGFEWMGAGRKDSDSKATLFRRCQRGLEAQYDAREKYGWGQLCPGGRQEVCEVCSKLSGLPVDCRQHPSCSRPKQGSPGGPDWGAIGGVVWSIYGDSLNFKDKACMAACMKFARGLRMFPNWARVTCKGLCGALERGGCGQLFLSCGKAQGYYQRNLCLAIYNAACSGE